MTLISEGVRRAAFRNPTGAPAADSAGGEAASTRILMRKWTAIGILLSGVALAAYFGTARGLIPFLAQSAAPRSAAVPVPVSAVTVQRRDIPVYMTGLGAVQAFLVKSRVDGQIVKINFAEGKDVHAGDVLVEI
jgi:membrane fusion protein, multidrug efflux system